MKEKLSLFVVALVESNTLLNVDSTTFQTYHWAQELKVIKKLKRTHFDFVQTSNSRFFYFELWFTKIEFETILEHKLKFISSLLFEDWLWQGNYFKELEQ